MNSALEQMIVSKKVPHALLFSGHNLKTIAEKFITDLIGKYEHPDVHEYFPEGKVDMHPVANLRKLNHEVGFVPYQAEWKIFVIHDAEKMLVTSANALLKTLEEPTAKTILILLSKHPEKLLSTILSRCHKLHFPEKTTYSEHKILDVLTKKMLLSDFEETDDIDGLLQTVLLWYRDRLLVNIEGAQAHLTFPQFIEHIKKTPLIPLEKVEKALAQTKLGVERFTKLSTCLEALFIQLQY